MFKLTGKYLKKYWYLAILAPLFMILEVTMDMVMNQYMSNIIDLINVEDIATINHNAIIENGLWMLGVVLVGVVCGILSGVFTNLVTFKASNDMRKDLFTKIMNLSYHQTDKFSTGSLITRVTNDITQIQNTIAMSLRMMVRAGAMFVLGIIFTVGIDARFSTILLIVLPIELALMGVFMGSAFPLFGKLQKKLDKVNTIVHENVTGARVVKAFSKEEYESTRFDEANIDYTNLQLKINKMFALLSPVMMLIIYAVQVAIYLIGGKDIFDNAANGISLGDLTRAITYIVMICTSMVMLGMMLSFFARAFASAKRVNEVLSCDEEIKNGRKIPEVDFKEHGVIEFNNVGFRYPDANANVLSNLTFKINQGETVAIVGATGSGKSSLVNLITRFYDVSEGQIKIDGYDIKDFDLTQLRDKISICLQKAELFSGTVLENIRWGKIDASFEEVVQAARIAQVEEFVENMPDKYDEYIEEKGASLSGGQKQRLSIARAIIRDPEILIFDDSTSALDLVTEAKLHKQLRELKASTTKIVVAQRIATAKNAERIIVLENGTIAAFDSHENLMKNCSIYQDIYKSQMKEGSVYDE